MNSIKHLKRWIFASFVLEVRKHQEQGFPLYIEGDDRDTGKSPDHMELRIDGPYVRNVGTKGEMCAFIEVNILGNTTRSMERYRRENLQGLMADILNRDFCIIKTGNEGKIPEDNGSTVGVMQLLPTDQIKVSDFGNITDTTEVYQMVAEAHYEMYFTLEN